MDVSDTYLYKVKISSPLGVHGLYGTVFVASATIVLRRSFSPGPRLVISNELNLQLAVTVRFKTPAHLGSFFQKPHSSAV